MSDQPVQVLDSIELCVILYLFRLNMLYEITCIGSTSYGVEKVNFKFGSIAYTIVRIHILGN